MEHNADDTEKINPRFSALQRAEIAEIQRRRIIRADPHGFSALQRAEIAEMRAGVSREQARALVSVLFNEPKLLKCQQHRRAEHRRISFSALQRAEIAEMRLAL